MDLYDLGIIIIPIWRESLAFSSYYDRLTTDPTVVELTLQGNSMVPVKQVFLDDGWRPG